MREIKFRAWDKENRVMFYSEDNQNDDFTFISEKRGLQFYYIDKSDRYLQDTNSVLMQYTGLKDVNGTEIYEGDIFKLVNLQEDFNGKIAKIHWNEKIPGYFYTYINEEEKHSLTKGAANHIEVIGNIYEDKHLLEGDPNA